MSSGRKDKSFPGRTLSLVALFLFLTVPAQAAEQPLFGPVTYEVKERYGKENRYQETIAAKDGLYLIELQNGGVFSQRPDLLSFSVNGELLLKEGPYAYAYLACFVRLKEANVIELSIRDFRPSPFKKPRLSARNAMITIMPATVKLTGIVLGVQAWEDVKYYVDSLLKIPSPESSALAFAAADLKKEPEARAESLRSLSARKDPNARDFFLNRFFDPAESSLVRRDAVIALGALGETALLPAILQGVLDPDEEIRAGSVRALSSYKEEETQAPIVKMLGRMDPTMRLGVVRSFVSVGWRPMGMLLEFVASPDPDLANMGTAMLIGSSDRRAVDALLVYLESPGPRDVGLIVTALGESKDQRALAPITRMARDPERGKGCEAELGTALAALGDPQAADLIVAMIKRMDDRNPAYYKLLNIYQKLTGIEYKQSGKP